MEIKGFTYDEDDRESLLDKERLALIKVTAAHEAGHLCTAFYLGLEIDKATFDFSNTIKGNSFFVVDEGSENDGIVTVAGFVGEYLIMGKKWMRNTGILGMSGDNKMLKKSGFTSNQIDAFVQKSNELLLNHQDKFKKLFQYLENRIMLADKRYSEILEIGKDDILRCLV